MSSNRLEAVCTNCKKTRQPLKRWHEHVIREWAAYYCFDCLQSRVSHEPIKINPFTDLGQTGGAA